VKLYATPPLDPAVERVLLAALAETGADDDRPAYSAAWRLAAVHEGVEREEDSGDPAGYAFSPRSTRGATRA
jgi:hypothetical protein